LGGLLTVPSLYSEESAAIFLLQQKNEAPLLGEEAIATRNLLHSIQETAFIVSREGGILDFVLPHESMSLSSAPTIGMRIYDVLAPMIAICHAQQVAEMSRKGCEVTKETIYCRGRAVLRAVPLVSSNRGEVLSYVLYVRDVTDERLWEQRIRETEEHYRAITEFANDWIFWMNSDKTIQYVRHFAPPPRLTCTPPPSDVAIVRDDNRTKQG
jgi:hypothetical protein